MTILARLIPYLGIALLVAANVSGLVREAGFGPLEYALGGAGIALFLTVLLRGGARGGAAAWRGWAPAAVYTALALACAAMLYLIALQHNRTIDLTSARVHSLSDLTVRVLEGLDRPVRLVAFTELPRETESFLARFAAASPFVSYSIHNPVRDAMAAQQFDSQVLPEDIFVIAETPGGAQRQKRLSAFDKLDEGAIVNAIIEVTRDAARKLYFLTGHGERAIQRPARPAPNELDPTISEAVQLLREKAFEIEEWPLVEKGFIPEDAAALVVAGPAADPSPAALDVIRAYLDRGGKMLLMLDPPRTRRARFDGLQKILLDYGLAAPDSYVLDDNALTGGDTISRIFAPLVAMKGRHAIVQNLPSGQAVLMPFVRPIMISEQPPSDVRVEELLYTSEGSWLAEAAVVLLRGEAPPPDPKTQRPYPIAALAWKPKGALRGAGARVLAVGDSDMFTNDLLSEMSLVLLLNSINWLTESENLIAIPPKTMPDTPLYLSARQSRVLFAALVVTLPSLILIGGLGFTLHRRRTR